MSEPSILPDEYRRRVESGFKACEWSTANPFRSIAADRLERLGGLHRPPRVADQQTITAEEPAVEMMRDLPAAKTEPTAEF